MWRFASKESEKTVITKDILLMSIGTVDYILCRRCGYHLIGRVVKTEFLFNINRIAVFKVSTTWIYLGCGSIQREQFIIRETRLN